MSLLITLPSTIVWPRGKQDPTKRPLGYNIESYSPSWWGIHSSDQTTIEPPRLRGVIANLGKANNCGVVANTQEEHKPHQLLNGVKKPHMGLSTAPRSPRDADWLMSTVRLLLASKDSAVWKGKVDMKETLMWHRTRECLVGSRRDHLAAIVAS
jgi:hypothetical protein